MRKALMAFAVTSAFATLLSAQAPERKNDTLNQRERVFSQDIHVWFERVGAIGLNSPDGHSALFAPGTEDRALLQLTPSGAAVRLIPSALSGTYRVTFGPNSDLVFAGKRNGQTGWFRVVNNQPVSLPIPADAFFPTWSRNGALVAFFRGGAPDSLFAGPLGDARAYPAGDEPTGFAWLPGDTALVVVSRQATGSSSLFRIDVPSGRKTMIAEDLDANTQFSPISVAPDGRHAYVGLASAVAPVAEARHEPEADRRLSVYEIDLATGARRIVVPHPTNGEAYAPFVAGNFLYWMQSATDLSVVTVPITGGPTALVMHDAQVPSWRPDGRQIGFVYGNWRMADWAISWDAGAVNVDAQGHPTGGYVPIIAGYHEDFQPVWRPHDTWIAFHSHRAATPVPYYSAPGATDDIWLKRIGAPPRDTAEIRLTDYGWEAGSPDWSRDGQRLVFTSFAKGGAPGVSYAFVVSIDTVTGRVLEHHQLHLAAGVHNALWAAWSPLGDDLALEEDLGHGRHAIWVQDAEGLHGRKVVEYPMQTYGGVSWTPDGKSLVYSALTNGHMQLFKVAATGGAATQLTHDSANVFLPSVSPDGRLIAATRLSYRNEVWRAPLQSLTATLGAVRN